MRRQPVDSSSIASIGYDGISQTLEIEFLDGGIYQYFNVPKYVYDDIMNANSHGRYFAQNIKNLYRYSKVKKIT